MIPTCSIAPFKRAWFLRFYQKKFLIALVSDKSEHVNYLLANRDVTMR